MPGKSSNLGQFWQELKRRRVIHVVTVYATAAFVIIELVNNLAEPLNPSRVTNHCNYCACYWIPAGHCFIMAI